MTRRSRPEREPTDALTRQERRDRRREAERQRMPVHSKAVGSLVQAAILRRQRRGAGSKGKRGR